MIARSATALVALTVLAGPTPADAGFAQRPVVPGIGPAVAQHARDVYQRGIAQANRPDVFAKVGDSITESGSFLQGIGCREEQLATHQELRAPIDYFRARSLPSGFTDAWCGDSNSFTRASAAATQGWSVDDVLARDTGMSGCPAPHDTHLRCELHRLRPAVALVMVGTNDLERFNDRGRFRRGLERVVAETESYGVVPILSTIPPRTDSSRMAARVAPYNRVVAAIASARRVPLINYWRAMTAPGMVNRGISEDGVHPNLYGNCRDPIGCQAYTFSAQALRYGYNQRNLTALQALAKFRRVVEQGGPADR